jgi:SNF2 family DNA or RNA helicase
MSASALLPLTECSAVPLTSRLIGAILAFLDTPLNQSKILEYAKLTGLLEQYPKKNQESTCTSALETLTTLGWIKAQGKEKYLAFSFDGHPELLAYLITLLIEQDLFKKIEDAFLKQIYIARGYNTIRVSSSSYAWIGFKLALFTGKSSEQVKLWQNACEEYSLQNKGNLYLRACLHPLLPQLIDLMDPIVRETVQSQLCHAPFYELQNTDPIKHVQNYIQTLADKQSSPSLSHTTFSLSLSWWKNQILYGKLEETANYQGIEKELLHISIACLRSETPLALLPTFQAILKQYRKETKKRTYLFTGLPGYLYVLLLLLGNTPESHQEVESYLGYALKQENPFPVDQAIFNTLIFFKEIKAGRLDIKTLEKESPQYSDELPFYTFWSLLVLHWAGCHPLVQKNKNALIASFEKAKQLEWRWIAAELAQLLVELGEKKYAPYAIAFQKEQACKSLIHWFKQEETWERQLSALTRLGAAKVSTGAHPKNTTQDQIILAWMIAYYDRTQRLEIKEARERKLSSQGKLTKGKAFSLKRLFSEKIDGLESATQQDQNVIHAISHDYQYRYSHSDFYVDPARGFTALAGHPYIFWEDAPDVRVEIVQKHIELLVRKNKNKLYLELYPPILDNQECSVMVHKETPTRLNVYTIDEAFHDIARIIGTGLQVPLEAKDSVLNAITALAPMITIQSDIGGGAEHAEQREADPRIHALLLPWQQGLKMQLRVRPFGESGTYYAPGQGAECVLADIEGKTVQARRQLVAEKNNRKKLIEACPILEEAEYLHEEWHFEETEPSLELLLQLEELREYVHLSWPEGQPFKLAAQRLDGKSFSLRIQSDQDWFALQGELKINEGHVLDFRKLLELVRSTPGRFIALGNNEFLTLTESFQRRLKELERLAETNHKSVRVHALASSSLQDFTEEIGELNVDKEWKTHIQRIEQLETLQTHIPCTLQAELRDYQQEGFHWLSRLAHWGVGACLADDMGLGKTVQLLALLLDRSMSGPALVIAPTSVCTNWYAEAVRFAPSLNLRLFGAGKREEELQDLGARDLVIASYGLLQQESERFNQIKWHTIVLDEAQAIKNANTLRSKAVMTLQADFKVIATGTPLENHLGELWNLFRFINPGLLGSQERFNERFANPIERQKDTSARQRLRRLIQPFVLRRTKAQVLAELPSKTEIVREVELSKTERDLYEALRQSAVERLAGLETIEAGQRHIQILAEMMKLRRVCCNPSLVAPELGLSSSKLEVFAELLEELLENHHKALVFSQFVDHLALIRTYLETKKIAYQYLDGATPMQERKKRVEAFQAGKGDVFLISLKAGGTGLNLTAADYVIHMDPWWNPAVEDQASDRAHRMGQKRPVTIYRLVAKHTIEESIVNLHTHKRDLADSLLEGSDTSGKLSAKDMIALLQEEWK